MWEYFLQFSSPHGRPAGQGEQASELKIKHLPLFGCVPLGAGRGLVNRSSQDKQYKDDAVESRLANSVL